MDGKKIMMTGLNEAYFLRASKKTSRLIRFPDGVSRHITLSEWQWEVFDRLIKYKNWQVGELAREAYNLTVDLCNHQERFEEELRYAFEAFIKDNMYFVMSEDDKNWTSSNERF